MGGRGSLGGARSTYRGDSTSEFRQRQLFNSNNSNTSDSGGGGGSSKSNNKGTTSADTGGIDSGGGNGSGGGGSVNDVKQPDTSTEDINQQEIPPDEDLKDLFEQSDIFEELIDKALSESQYKAQYPRYWNRWLKENGLEDPEAPEPVPDLVMSFESDVSDSKQLEKVNQFAAVPLRVRQTLGDRGIKINVGKRADSTARWADYEAATGYTSGSKVGDGREIGTLNFYDPQFNEIFISADSTDGSKNVVAHEIGHGIEAKWLSEPVDVEWVPDEGPTEVYQVSHISRDDRDWKFIHDNFVKNNEGIDSYYRGGPSGSSDEDGRSEMFAEAYAAYIRGGRVGLRGFLAAVPTSVEDDDSDFNPREYAIDTILAVWTRYEII